MANPRARATSAQPGHTPERPLLLNPYQPADNPTRHIAWSAHVPRAHRRSTRGRMTIRVFALDEPDLLFDERRDLLAMVAQMLTLAEDLPPGSFNRTSTRGVLMLCLDGTRPHTAMLEANLGARIRAL